MIRNLVVYFLQVGLVIGVGAALPYLFRLRAPKPRLIYLHLLLLGCIALPIIQPWRSAQVLVKSGQVSFTTGPMQVLRTSGYHLPSLSASEATLGAIAAGALIRLLWLCIGFARLRRYRRTGEQLLPLPPEARTIGARLGITAEIWLSDEITSPVTFGMSNPVILVPRSFLDFAAPAREAVLCHEMLHIQRNDWLYAVAEEFVRCLLWFHPAVWWLLGRIQLTREQVVDQSAIECTQAPEQYLDALIAIAATRLQSDLAPAPLFLKKRHLRKRVASIVKGVGMSKRSLIVSTFAVFSALPLVVGIAVWQFPLMAAPQEVQDGPGVTVKNGYSKILHRTAIPYPAEANGASGNVVVSVSVNPNGEVTDARVVSSQGPDVFRKAALASVLNWHFATDAWQVGPGDSRPMPPEFEIGIEFSGSQARASEPVQPPQSVGKSFVVEGLDLSSLPQLLRDKVAAANLIREGEIMQWSRFRDIEQGLKAIDSHLRLTGAIKNDKTVRMRVSLASENPLLKPQIEANPPNQDGTPPQRIRVGGNVQATNLILKVTPIYPTEAKAAHVQGLVRMNVEIGKDGHVTHIELVSGPPLLVPTAMDAVKQWVYRPTLLNGQPVDVLTVVDVNFTLLE